MGDVLTALDMNTWTVPLAGIKSANQTSLNNTYINDADLRFAVAANSTYEYRAYIRYSAGTGQDIKFSFSAPAGATCLYNVLRNDLSGNFQGNGEYTASDNIPAQGATVGVIRTVVMTGFIATGGTAGNLIVQWAQNVTGGGFATVVYQNSYIIGRHIG